jgi:spore maturation protein CgeB
MKILYIGTDSLSSTSAHRIEAFRRLGHEVFVVDPFKAYANNGFWPNIHWKTGYRFVLNKVNKYVLNGVAGKSFDIIFVNHGENVCHSLLKTLKDHTPWLVNYNVDDPFGHRDGARWASYRKSVCAYDLLVVKRIENIDEAIRYGAKRVMREPICYDRIAHQSLSLSNQDIGKWGGDVVFVGSWMPERGPFMAKLVERGIPLSIYGNGWRKSRYWKGFQSAYRGPAIFGTDYIKAIQASKIALCLLSRGNRDQHTHRTFEIPFIGSVLCAERTSDHLSFYQEGVEAIFWSNADECADRCFEILANPERLKLMALAGHERVKILEQSNDDVMARILKYLKTDPAQWQRDT